MSSCRPRSGLLATAVLVASAGGIFAAVSTSAVAEGAHNSGKHCSVQNAGGDPNSEAIGGWAYDVDFVCPFRVSSFSIRTNKRVKAGLGKSGLPSPSGSANLSSGQQVNFSCKTTSTKSYRCTAKSSIPAHTAIVEGFDSSTACTGKGVLKARLMVNGRMTRLSFNGKTTTGSLTGGCG